MQLHKDGMASFPLNVYEPVTKGTMKGRRIAETPEQKLFSTKPNPLADRTTWMRGLADDYWWYGEAFVVGRYTGEDAIEDVRRIPAKHVMRIEVVDDQKIYHVRESADGRNWTERVFPQANERVCHIIREPDDYGIRGVPLLAHAAETLGLHRQIMTSATSYYAKAVRPSLVYKAATGTILNDEAVANLRAGLKDTFGGAENAGEVAVIQGGDLDQLKDVTAEDARILEALASATNTVAMLFGLVPSDLGDQSQSKYASVAADRQDQVTRVFRCHLDTFETALNAAFFPDGDRWLEFDTDEALRGDAASFQTYIQAGLAGGYFLRSEAREWLGVEPVEGLDTPLYPLNQGPEMAGDSDQADAEQPAEEVAPVEAGDIMPILDKVKSGEYPPETAKTLILVANPKMAQDIVDHMVDGLIPPAAPVAVVAPAEPIVTPTENNIVSQETAF